MTGATVSKGYCNTGQTTTEYRGTMHHRTAEKYQYNTVKGKPAGK